MSQRGDPWPFFFTGPPSLANLQAPLIVNAVVWFQDYNKKLQTEHAMPTKRSDHDDDDMQEDEIWRLLFRYKAVKALVGLFVTIIALYLIYSLLICICRMRISVPATAVWKRPPMTKSPKSPLSIFFSIFCCTPPDRNVISQKMTETIHCQVEVWRSLGRNGMQ